jgi:hypothetical protein
MRRFLTGVACVVPALAVMASPGAAQNYPWCSIRTAASGGCYYDSWEQCMVTISGAGGRCYQNPAVPPRVEASAQAQQRSKHRFRQR